MAEALLVKSGGGTDSSDLTATLSQVLSGYTAMTNDSNDDPGTGTMPNRGAVTQSLNAGGSYTIPQGYHNGSGKVTANSLSSQTSGNASSAQILTGYNAWVNGSNINGSMPNRGNLNFNPSNSTSQSVASGYYSGGTLSSANAYNAGYSAGQASRNTYNIYFWIYDGADNSVGYAYINQGTSKIYINSFSSTNTGHNPNGICTIVDENTGGNAFYQTGGISGAWVNLDPSHHYRIEIRSGGGYYHTVTFNATAYWS